MILHWIGHNGGELAFRLLLLCKVGTERSVSIKVRHLKIVAELFINAEGFIFCGSSGNGLHHLEGSNVAVPVIVQMLQEGFGDAIEDERLKRFDDSFLLTESLFRRSKISFGLFDLSGSC